MEEDRYVIFTVIARILRVVIIARARKDGPVRFAIQISENVLQALAFITPRVPTHPVASTAHVQLVGMVTRVSMT